MIHFFLTGGGLYAAVFIAIFREIVANVVNFF